MDTTSSSASSLRSASALLFCRMCQAVYRQPKILLCLHSFCKSCLMNIMAQEADNEVIVCPLCTYKQRLPPSGVQELPDNCFLSRMCQEYVTEVQSHLVARSLYSDTNRSSSEFTALRSKLTDEITKNNLSLSRQNSQEVKLSNEDLPRDSTTNKTSSASSDSPINALEAINNLSKLQAKIMSLQGEALRVTYAIDHVNQSMIEWHQHKEDLKRAVQRRSAQFQFFIKRMEHQLITQIEGKHVDDEFYAESDRCKTELRKILKNILHEVGVLKNIQELGKDYEISILSSNLLKQSVGLVHVLMRKFHFDMNVPTQSIEEIVAECFGEIKLNFQETKVFDPELLDFKDLTIEDLTKDVSEFSTVYNENGETSLLGDEEMAEVATSKTSQRSFSDSSSVSYRTDHVSDKDKAREHLAQFQNARETLRTRRREILAHGQQAREDATLLWDETRRYPRSAMRRERVQSLDRTFTPVIKTASRTGLPFKSNTSIITLSKDQDKVSENNEERLPDPQKQIRLQYEQIPEDINVPSPVIEGVSLPKTSTKVLVKQTSDPHSTHGLLSSTEPMSTIDLPLQTNSHSAMEHLSTIHLLNPYSSSLFMGRRHSSDHGSHGKDLPLTQPHDKLISRLQRRATSSAADRKTKMEFLRETWQKRKEILIQNEGFLSSDSAVKHGVKHHSQTQQPKVHDSHDSSHETEASHRASDDLGSMQQIPESLDLNMTEHNGTEDSKTGGKPCTTSSDVQSQSNVQGLRLESERAIQSTLSLTASSTSPHLTATSPAVQSSVINSSVAATTESPTPPQAVQETTQGSTASSRYSRLYTKPTESIDVPSLIAAMYKGKESSIIGSTRATNTHQPSESVPETQVNAIASTVERTTTGAITLTKSTASTPYSNQTESQIYTIVPSEMVQEVNSELHNPQKPRRFPFSFGSKFREGVNRRHTIELGKTSLQDSLQVTSSDMPSSNAALTENMAANSQIQRSGPGSSSASSELITTMPSQAGVMIEEISPDQSVASETSGALSFIPSSLQAPTSPNASDSVQKMRMRELARKKRERWRHLTIH